MNLSLSHLAPWLRRADLRLAGFGISAVVAVYVGFVAVPVSTAEAWVTRGGYYVMLVTVGLFCHALWRLRGEFARHSRALTAREAVVTAALIAGFSFLAINSEPYRAKILNDEYVLQSTAFNLHYYRDVATMVRGYDLQGSFVSTDNFLDKRPFFYPFLVSLAHDLTGYRVANAFVINSLMLPVALLLAFAIGRLLAGFRAGLLAVLLLGTLPLLGQNATGSGMELTNAVMILAAMLLGAVFLAEPDERRLAAFLLATVLLAQSRYESALFVLSTALVVGAAWIQRRQIVLPWIGALVPWLLLPVALQNKVVSNTPILWELNERAETRFALSYFPENLRGAVSYLFNRDAERSNSLILSLLGALAVLWAIGSLIRAWRRGGPADPARAALAAFGLVILANTLLVLCYYWARFDDPMASRFSLPFHVLAAFAIVVMMADLDRWLPATRGLIAVVGIFSTAMAVSRYSYHHYSYLGAEEVEWQRRFVAALPPGERLIITGLSTVPWLLDKHPSILVGRARLVPDRLEYQLGPGGLFHEILVIQQLRPTTPEGRHAVLPEDRLPESFRLELLAEKRFGTRISRISRLAAVDLPADWRPPGSSPATPGSPARAAK